MKGLTGFRAPVLILALILAAGFLTSCALMEGRRVRAWDPRELSDHGGRNVHFLLDRVEVDAGADSERIGRNAARIGSLLLSRRNSAISEPEKTLKISLSLGEQVFLRGFSPMASVYGEISLCRDGDGTGFPDPDSLIGLYSQETRESLSSYPFLCSFLRQALKELP